MTWVRFHEELCNDEKSALSCASRFIYMRLSLKARPKRGYFVLPQGLDDVVAVQRAVAEEKREVAIAIKALSAGPDPMIRFEDIEGKRCLVVVNWEKWNPQRDDSAPRVHRHREEKKRKQERLVTGDGNALHGVAVTPTMDDVTPRARALIFSSLDSSLSPEQIQSVGDRSTEPPADPEERHVALTDKLTTELSAIAQLATVQDISATWLKFTGHYAGQWVHVAGKWQFWCVNEAKRERIERERVREDAQRRGHAAPGGATGNQYDGPAIRAERKRRDADYAQSRRDAAPPPIGALLATVGEKPTPAPADPEERPSETRAKAAPLVKLEVAREMTDEDRASARRDAAAALASFPEKAAS